MGRLSKYGIALAPSGPITSLLKGTLDLWSYDYQNPANSFRDESVRLRNLCDDALGQYTAELQARLLDLRKNLPEPTRENPYPPMEGLEAVKAMEEYLREIEALRTQIRSVCSPPNEYVRHGQAANEAFLGELATIDRELLAALSAINEDTIADVHQILDKRLRRVREFVAN